MIAGFVEASAFLADPAVSSDPFLAGKLRPGLPPEWASLGDGSTSMQLCDGAQHARLRRTVAAVLTTRRCAPLLETLHNSAPERLEALIAAGGGDLIADFVEPLIGNLTCDLLGVPTADRAALLEQARASTTMDHAAASAAMRAVDDYMTGLLTDKETRPGDDLCTSLALAEAAGELSRDEAVGTANLMVIAGLETEVSFLALTALTLLLAPLLVEELQGQPELLPVAVEELLRFLTPTRQTATRFATAEITVGGVVLPAGSVVDVDLLAANRDPARFADAEVLNPFRGDDKHLAFGHGAHFCPGATLARRESVAVLAALIPRIDRMTLAIPVPELTWHQNRFSRRPAVLPVTC